MSSIADYLKEGVRREAEELANAERDAIAAGKEPFDLAKLERLLNHGPQASREREHRANYYIFNKKMKTLEEYAAHLIKLEPWQDR